MTALLADIATVKEAVSDLSETEVIAEEVEGLNAEVDEILAQLQTLLAAHVKAGGAVVMTSHQALQVNCDVRFLNLGAGVAA